MPIKMYCWTSDSWDTWTQFKDNTPLVWEAILNLRWKRSFLLVRFRVRQKQKMTMTTSRMAPVYETICPHTKTIMSSTMWHRNGTHPFVHLFFIFIFFLPILSFLSFVILYFIFNSWHTRTYIQTQLETKVVFCLLKFPHGKRDNTTLSCWEIHSLFDLRMTILPFRMVFFLLRMAFTIYIIYIFPFEWI